MKRRKIRLGLAVALSWLLGSALMPEETGPLRLNPDLPVEAWYVRDADSEVTEMVITLPAGVRSVPAGLRGLALLTARVALEIPSAGEVRDLMEMGTRLSSWVTGDLAVLSMSVLSRHFEASLKILAGMLKQPLATGIRIQRIKEWMEDREALERDSPDTMMMRYMTDRFLGSMGYGGGTMGCRETRAAIRRQHVLDQLARFYTRERMRIAIATDLDASRVTRLLRRHLRSLPAGGSAATVVTDSGPACSAGDGRIRRELMQPLLAWGMPLPPLDGQNHVMAGILARHLARGVGSLAWNLRHRLGLAYTVDCRVNHHAAGGVLTVFLRTNPENISRAKSGMDGILEELHGRGITQAELEALINLETVAWFRRLESKREQAWCMASYVQDKRGIGSMTGYPRRLATLPLEGVNAFLKQVLDPGSRLFLVVGLPGESSPNEEETP